MDTQTKSSPMPIKLVINMLKHINDDYDDSCYEDMVAKAEATYSLIHTHITHDSTVGSMSDWNDLVKLLMIEQYYDLACYSLDFAIQSYPNSTELMSRYVSSGRRCSRYIECKTYYNRLRKTPVIKLSLACLDRMFWYNIYLWSSVATTQKELDRIISDIEDILEKMSKQYPNDDETIYNKSYFYHLCLKQRSKSKQILANALSKDLKLPTCARRMSIYMEQEMKFSESIKFINRALQDATEAGNEQSFDPQFVADLYLRSAKCKISIMNQSNDKNTDISSIFMDFERYLMTFNPRFWCPDILRDNIRYIRFHTCRLSQMSNSRIDYEKFSRLYDLMDE